MAERLWRGANWNDYPRYTVTIVIPGPRGGRRKPLIEASVNAESYDDAVAYVQEKLLGRCDITVEY
jgi:hypothetical protein